MTAGAPTIPVTRYHLVLYVAGELPADWLDRDHLTYTDDILEHVAEARFLRQLLDNSKWLLHLFAARMGYSPATDSDAWLATDEGRAWLVMQGDLSLAHRRHP